MKTSFKYQNKQSGHYFRGKLDILLLRKKNSKFYGSKLCIQNNLSLKDFQNEDREDKFRCGLNSGPTYQWRWHFTWSLLESSWKNGWLLEREGEIVIELFCINLIKLLSWQMWDWEKQFTGIVARWITFPYFKSCLLASRRTKYT